jgi:hypothetical protein
VSRDLFHGQRAVENFHFGDCAASRQKILPDSPKQTRANRYGTANNFRERCASPTLRIYLIPLHLISNLTILSGWGHDVRNVAGTLDI